MRCSGVRFSFPGLAPESCAAAAKAILAGGTVSPSSRPAVRPRRNCERSIVSGSSIFHTLTCVACDTRFKSYRARPWASFVMADITINSTDRHRRRLHPLGLRLMHWINALAMIIMIGSGWEIYNDEVIFGWLHFPRWMTIGGGAEGALQWHFAAMWLLMINGLCYLAYGFATGRFRRKLLPI